MFGLTFIEIIRLIFLEQKGEIEGGEASEAPVDNGGEGNEGGPQDGQPPAEPVPAEPQFGEFGNDAGKVWEAFQAREKEYGELKNKTTATEKNLAALRKTLQNYGVRYQQDENGELRLVVDQQKKERVRKFTDQHKALFDEPVLNAIRSLVEDMFEDSYEGREKATSEKRRQMQEFISARDEANQEMLEWFPQIKPGSEGFDAKFHELATKIWEEGFKHLPDGEFKAARIAARQLNISSNAIAKAKVDGFKQGKEDKKILRPVNPSQDKGGKPGNLSREEFLKLSPEEREKRNKESVGL